MTDRYEEIRRQCAFVEAFKRPSDEDIKSCSNDVQAYIEVMDNAYVSITRMAFELSKIQTKKVYGVCLNTDTTEGRGKSYIECFCEIEATARRLAEGKGTMGGPGGVSTYMAQTDMDNPHQWLGPINIVKPMDLDRKYQKILDEGRQAMTRAKQLGLSDDDIKALKRA